MGVSDVGRYALNGMVGVWGGICVGVLGSVDKDNWVKALPFGCVLNIGNGPQSGPSL